VEQKIIPIKGMHCKSCEIVLSEKLGAISGVSKVSVKFGTNNAIITARKMPDDNTIAAAVKEAGYEIGYEKKPLISKNKTVRRDVIIGIIIITILAIFVWKTKFADVTLLKTSGLNSSIAALIIGLTAGFSTCMALVGGLVLGISAQHAKKYPNVSAIKRFKPHLIFNLGRIAGFMFFGAIIGALGSIFQVSGNILGILMIFIGIAMAILGLNLTELFPKLKNITLPSKIGKTIDTRINKSGKYNSISTLVTGALTFFLPCGFTQAMQLVAIGSGSPVTGALIMGMFALGTAPGLLTIGGLTSIVKGAFAKSFFRIIGVGVVAMALINIMNGANLINIHLPDFESEQTITTMDKSVKKFETIYHLDNDISPNKFTAKVGQKSALIVEVKDDGQGCMSTIMIQGLNDKPQYLKSGKKLILDFTPTSTGEYKITCAMGVERGTIKVVR